jgi:hypothetical protein
MIPVIGYLAYVKRGSKLIELDYHPIYDQVFQLVAFFKFSD